MPPDAAPAPVFVDDSGRRHRTVRVIGWLIGAVTVGYLALLGISLVGSPGIVPLSLPALGRILPGPAAAPITGASSGVHNRGDLVAPAATPAAATAASTSATSVRPQAAIRHTTAATPRPSATPSATPTPSRTPQANPSPNGSARPSHGPSTRPTPRNTKRTVRTAAPTPTATAT